MVLVLALGNYFDTSIGSLLCYPVDFSLVTLIVTMMGPSLGNYLGKYLEAFLGFPFYFYLFLENKTRVS